MEAACRESNPDISGLGVRISFYLQTIALVLLAGRSLEEALSSVWTLLGTSFGLAISAFVSASQNVLPLYQAIIVTDLIWLSNFAIFMALATYNRHPRGSHAVQYCAIAQTCISMACMLYLWVRAPELDKIDVNGAAADVQRTTVFVILFKSVPATGVGRKIALSITGVLLAGYGGVSGLFLWRHVPHPWTPPEQRQTHRQRRVRQRRPSAANNIPPSPSLLHPPAPAAARSTATVNSRTPSTYPPRPLIANGVPTTPSAASAAPPSLPIDPHLSILFILFVVPYIIILGSTELQITRNTLCSSSGQDSWGFGQVLALTVTIVPVVITIQAFRKYRWRQRTRGERGFGNGSAVSV